MPTSYPNTLDFSNIAHQRDTVDAFAVLPAHILITHVLNSRNLPDPSDLARLRAVSREMRDAVAATGRDVYPLGALGAKKVIELGDLSALQLMHQHDELDQRGDLDSGDEDYNDYDKYNDDTFSLCTIAATEGQLEVLKWLRENDFPWSERTCNVAAQGGHLEVLQWAHANGCPWDWETCRMAALRDHLEILQWARANDCPWDATTCSGAAEGGHLKVLQWAHANGCPWDERTCSAVASSGHLEMLKWARANGCPWDRTTRDFASGHILEWAVANGVPEYF
jgi:hypothetical protein